MMSSPSSFVVRTISPHFGGGSGLKPLFCHLVALDLIQISPHFGGGSGLKREADTQARRDHQRDLPSLRWGERIETGSARADPFRTAKSPLTSVGGAD